MMSSAQIANDMARQRASCPPQPPTTSDLTISLRSTPSPIAPLQRCRPLQGLPPATETPHQTPDRIPSVFVHFFGDHVAWSHQIGTTSRSRMGDLTAPVPWKIANEQRGELFQIISRADADRGNSYDAAFAQSQCCPGCSMFLAKRDISGANRTCQCCGKDRVMAAFRCRQTIVLPLEDFAKSRDAPCRPKFGDVLDSSTLQLC